MIGEKILCGLDIGSQWIKASLVRFKKSQAFEVIGACDVPTRGLKNASVTDLRELSESIQFCCQELMKKTGMRFKEVQLGISGHMVGGRRSSAVIPLSDRGSKVITRNNVEKVKKDACLLGIKMEEEILHHFPLRYTIDDQHTVVNPLGLHGHKLETQLLLIVLNENILNNVVKAVNQARLEVVSVYYSSYAAAQATLEKRLRKEGCVFIDVGASMTSLLIFRNGHVHQMEIVPSGGDQITAAVAESLNLSFDLAEDIKKSYAVAVVEDTIKREEILVKRESGYVPMRREMICQAVEPKIKDWAQRVQDALMACPIFKEISSEIIMVGGGAFLPGLIEVFEQKMDVRVRMGKLTIPCSGLNNPALYSAAVGLCIGSKRGTFEMMPAEDPPKGISVIASRFRELYHEYF